MDKMIAMWVLLGVCILILLILFLKQKARFFLVFLLRAGSGMLLICGINNIVVRNGMEVLVGVNLISVLTSGSLGIPGVALLFAISALQIL